MDTEVILYSVMKEIDSAGKAGESGEFLIAQQ